MKIAKFALVIAAMAMVLGLSSCSKSDTSNPVASQNNSNLITNEVLLPPSDIAVASDVTIPSMENPMELVLPVDGRGMNGMDRDSDKGDDHAGMRGGMDKMGDRHHDRGGFFHLGFIFRSLNLTADQIAQIKTFMQTRNDCQKTLLQQLRDSEKPILDAANIARQAIIDQVKAGTLTKSRIVAMSFCEPRSWTRVLSS